MMNKVKTDGSMTYESYRKMTEDLLAQNKTTGENQSEEMIHYTKMNVTRMRRIDKHIPLSDELKEVLDQIKKPQRWTVLTEPWCGDAAQIVPVFNKIAEECPQITLDILLRDENLELMDQYLTNGGRSIPKLIVTDEESGDEIFNWGPRPASAQKLVIELKESGLPLMEMATQLHTWYAKNKTEDTQAELVTELKAVI